MDFNYTTAVSHKWKSHIKYLVNALSFNDIIFITMSEKVI